MAHGETSASRAARTGAAQTAETAAVLESGPEETTPSPRTAAIGNAVYHATGRRVRDLSITPAKLPG